MRVVEWLFGLMRVRTLIGQDVEVVGWYRRGPLPYVETRRIIRSDGTEHTSYTFPPKLIVAILLIIGGFILGVWRP